MCDVVGGKRHGVGGHDLARHSGCEQVQRVVVVANEVGRSRERVDDSGAEFRLHRRQDGVTDSDTRITLVRVVGVFPGVESLCERRRVGRLPCDIEQRSTNQSVEFRHSAKAARPAPPGESE